MNIVTLTEIKSHCRIDGNAEDTTLTLYGNAAERMVLNLTDRSLESFYEDYGTVPEDIKTAILLLVSHQYDHREPVSMQNLYSVPYTLDAYIKPYMIL